MRRFICVLLETNAIDGRTKSVRFRRPPFGFGSCCSNRPRGQIIGRWPAADVVVDSRPSPIAVPPARGQRPNNAETYCCRQRVCTTSITFPHPVRVIRIGCQKYVYNTRVTPPDRRIAAAAATTTTPPSTARNIRRRRYSFSLVSFSTRRKRQTFARRVSNNCMRFVLNCKIIVSRRPVHTGRILRIVFVRLPPPPPPPCRIGLETIPCEKSKRPRPRYTR